MMKSLAICVLAIGLVSCASKKAELSTEAAAIKPVEVRTARAVRREVAASFDETGTFVAEETSDIAPPVAGRVIKTPVDVGTFVKQGQVICELDHRDAELKLEQMKAQLAEATAGVKQAEVRIGMGTGKFDESRVP